MCVNHSSKSKVPTTLILYSISILLAFVSAFSGIEFLKSSGLLIAELFIRIFKCISLPIIALSIIVTLSQHGAERMNRMAKRTLLYTISTTIIAAAVTGVLYILISPSNVTTEPSIMPVTNQIGYGQYLVNLIPTNLFEPFIEHQVMGVLLVGIVLGLAIRFIQDTTAKSIISSVFKGAHSIFLVITGWVVKIIPLGLYGFITTTIVQLQEGSSLQGISEYLLVILLANVIQGFVILPMWLYSKGIAPFDAMKRMMPALSLAFFSKSSTSTLPVTIETAEKKLGVHPSVSRFILPLCTTINMNGCAAFIFATVIYLMQNNGMEITYATMFSWVFIASIAAIGNAGVPMGCFFLSASLLSSMNVPITLMGIILPFYGLIDMVETSLNVWSDVCVTKVINDSETHNHMVPKVVAS